MTTSITNYGLTTEEKVRIVLEAPGTISAAEIGRRVGLSRQAVRMIRTGKLHAGVLPDLPRKEPCHGYLRCWHCRLAAKTRSDKERMRQRRHHDVEEPIPWCSIGIPESVDPTYARECPAFEAVD